MLLPVMLFALWLAVVMVLVAACRMAARGEIGAGEQDRARDRPSRSPASLHDPQLTARGV
jgi:hypothetical protein